ncbi:MAG: TiaS agmantine-binding domain-containing protein [Candidatus Asgardarchaeia archaeon]
MEDLSDESIQTNRVFGMGITMHIGFDDTDSVRGGCTTYIAALLAERLEDLGAKFIDYPNLIRLNPNIPYKTRGNGAIALRIKVDEAIIEKVKEETISIIRKNYEVGFKDTDPGIVFYEGERLDEEIKELSKLALSELVPIEKAISIMEKHGIEYHRIGEGRGIVGGLAAIGYVFEDYTYELLAYRMENNRGTKRRILEESVYIMDEETRPYTFNNVDFSERRVLITPHGPDPVLFGIRGEDPTVLLKAFYKLVVFEPIERWVIFRTNQGTDAHLKETKISEIKPYSCVVIKGKVVGNPKVIPGGHVIFKISDGTGTIECAAYSPTRELNRVSSKLIEGDLVRVYGGVHLPKKVGRLTVNVEKLEILKLNELYRYENPICPKCGSRMKSEGFMKGYQCKKCKYRIKNPDKVRVKVKRELSTGLYFAAPKAQRHLTKPKRRYGLEKMGEPPKMIDIWHFP